MITGISLLKNLDSKVDFYVLSMMIAPINRRAKTNFANVVQRINARNHKMKSMR